MLTGGPGDDFIEPGAGLDIPNGGPGRDRISFDDGRPGPVAFNLGVGGTTVDGGEDDEGFEDVTGTPFNDTLVGDPGPNDIDGLGGRDSLDGFIGDDVIDGGAGDDASLVGDDDDDVLIGGAGVTSQVTGGNGSDTVSYEDRTGGLAIDVGAGALPAVTAFSSIENVRGTSGDDTFTGAPAPNTITGFEGGPGTDVLDGADVFSETFAGGDGRRHAARRRGRRRLHRRAGQRHRRLRRAVPHRRGHRDADRRRDHGGRRRPPGRRDRERDRRVGRRRPRRQRRAPTSWTAAPARTAVSGAGGADVLIGGAQDDTVAGGAGSDTMLLGAGDDSFAADEGEADVVDCSTGTDTGAFDALDTLIDCEPTPTPTPTPDAHAVTFADGDAHAVTFPDAARRHPAAATADRVPDLGEVRRVRGLLARHEAHRAPPARGRQGRHHVQGGEERPREEGRGRPMPIRLAHDNAPRFRSKVAFAPLFKGRKLTPGTLITITVTAPATIGKVVSYTTRDGKKPRRVLRCVAPGQSPGRC